jgi:hypothetical protein
LPDEIRPVRGLDAPKLASALQTTFSFLSAPNEPKGGGLEFLNGRFAAGDHYILITKLAIFNDGINIQVPTNTDDAELVLQRALALALELGVRRPASEPLHFFQSTIIADFETSLEGIIPGALLKKISKAMPIAGESQLLNIATNFDATTIADGRWRGINPTVFRIDRRASVPYELNRYFCVANTTSSDHIDLLKDFEKFALKTRE